MAEGESQGGKEGERGGRGTGNREEGGRREGDYSSTIRAGIHPNSLAGSYGVAPFCVWCTSGLLRSHSYMELRLPRSRLFLSVTP